MSNTAVLSQQTAVRRALGALVEPGSVVELRVLNPFVGWKKTISGYFTDLDKMAKEAEELNGKAPGVYLTLNPVDPSLLARACNRTKEQAKETTGDASITRRRWLPIDLDAVRPSGISSTDEEHKAAIDRAIEIRKWLRTQGWPDMIAADSGNGAHLLPAIDLPNDEASRVLVERSLKALDFLFSDERVKVDLTTHNAARIWKLYGTKVCKGDSTPDRPHRTATLLHTPDERHIVTVEQLEALAAALPLQEPAPAFSSRNSTYGGAEAFDLQQWMHQHGIGVHRQLSWSGDTVYHLDACPFDSSHRAPDSYIGQKPSGAVYFHCRHNSCDGRDWLALRSSLDPEYAERKRAWESGELSRPRMGTSELPSLRNGTSTHNAVCVERIDTPFNIGEAVPWPEPIDEAAYRGPAGQFVRVVEPHTEADPVALLLQFLACYGNAIGRSAFFTAEADRHYCNEYLVLVGNTAQGGKGTSWGQVRRLFDMLNDTWLSDCQKSGLSSGEGLIYHVRNPLEKQQTSKKTGEIETVLVDEGAKDKRLMVVESEFASVLKVLGRDGNTLSSQLRDSWDRGDMSTLTKNSPLTATGAHVSIIGHITKTELLRHITETEAANGFANRFLWACVKRSKLLPEGGAVDVDALSAVKGDLCDAIEYGKHAGELTRDKEARSLWRRVYPELKRDFPGLLGALLSRGPAHVTRLSLIYALLDCSPVVQRVHLESALAVWEYVENSVKHIFGDKLGDAIADELLSSLRRSQDGMTRSDIHNLFGRHNSTARLSKALTLLLSQGLVSREEVETGGRPAEIWKAVQ